MYLRNNIYQTTMEFSGREKHAKSSFTKTMWNLDMGRKTKSLAGKLVTLTHAPGRPVDFS